jgi:hypothetical protein
MGSEVSALDFLREVRHSCGASKHFATQFKQRPPTKGPFAFVPHGFVRRRMGCVLEMDTRAFPSTGKSRPVIDATRASEIALALYDICRQIPSGDAGVGEIGGGHGAAASMLSSMRRASAGWAI